MKRANHEGQWKQLPSGKWRLAQMVDGHRVYGPAAKTKPEARALLREKLEAASKPKEAPQPNFAAFYAEQLPRIKAQLAPTTYALYETVYENFVRMHPVGGIKLTDLTADHMQSWSDQFKDRKPRSAARYLQCAKAILERAVQTRRLTHNPASPIRTAKIEEHDKDLLDRSAVDRLLKQDMTPRFRIGLLLCLHGLRRAEACGLKYEDFDGDGITIKRQALEVNGELIIRETTKTGDRRWVPVDAQLKAALREGTGWVLATTAGTPLRPRNLAREWTTLVKGTEFEGMTLHDLRSTFGMLLLEKGVDVRTASEMMGHSPAMLAKIYARSRKDLKQEALQRVFG